MSIFSRRKRTRHLASLAISAVATSLCSSQVALCLPFVVSIEGISFDGNNVYILGFNVNACEHKSEWETKVGEYNVYTTLEKLEFLGKIGKDAHVMNLTECEDVTINFSRYFEAEDILNRLKQEFEKEQEEEQEEEEPSIEPNREQDEKLWMERELKQDEQDVRNVNRICNLIGEYEWDSGYADEYSIEINANGDSGLKENLRKIILCDPLIQHGLKYPKCYSNVKMINGELRKITITKQEDKYCIEVKLKK